ncbi:MAG: hypothetical protein HIU84_08300 [Acidobacteria bacterium]|nr:hypothetical protein [Acidobacteriota bacterium]
MNSLNGGSHRTRAACGWWPTVVGVRAECRAATALLLELSEPADFVAGQYFLVRVRVGAVIIIVATVVDDRDHLSRRAWCPRVPLTRETGKREPSSSPLGRDITLLW